MFEHLAISAFTGKRARGNDDCVIKEDLLFIKEWLDSDNFSILATNNNEIKVTVMENLLINKYKLSLNMNGQFFNFGTC